MKKFIRFIAAVMLLLFCFPWLSGCDNRKPENAFEYPDKSVFSFKCDIKETTVKKGETIIIDCSLENTSENDFYMEHGVETITYSYNNESEYMDAIALLDSFESSEKISRKLELEAKESGKIIVTAEIRLRPERYSESYKTYTYEKEFDVTVK